jgi:hypothetical protein
MIELKPANSGGYRAYWDNGACVGEVYREVDGYYVWWPESAGGGFLDEHFLRSMADKLHELNRQWDEQVRKDCCGPSTEATGSSYIPSKNDSVPF